MQSSVSPYLRQEDAGKKMKLKEVTGKVNSRTVGFLAVVYVKLR